MVSMECPHCQRRIELDESRRGRPARCPLCRGMFRAPLFDGERGIAAGSAGGRARPDALLMGGAVFAAVGFLLAAAALLAYFTGGGRLPVPWNVLLATLPLPLIPIGITWYAVRRTERQALVFGARIVAYLWLGVQVYLTFKPLVNK